MKWLYLISLLLIAAIVAQNDKEEEDTGLPLADLCDQDACQLPNCRCSSVNVPGGLAARDVPQFVTVTFDDAVNVNNIETYREILYQRSNKNGCPASATFYINHEYTNYQLVNELYNNGFEIALHSISHQTNQDYWRYATVDDMKKEFVDQKTQMSYLANIPESEVKGVRIPFLQMTGNASYQAMAEGNLVYDSSWPTTSYLDPGLWPYTLHYASIQDCPVPPCPTASIPGPWVFPMVSWLDNAGGFCSMVDACFPDNRPNVNDEEGWYQFILTNFERHYAGNRAPFGFFVHEWFIASNPAVKNAFVRFLNTINNLNDVFMVNSNEVIDWVKDPIPLTEYRTKACRHYTRTTCRSTTCPLRSDHNGLQYWLAICNTCPRVYPWLGNPLGQ